jgi:hypothetical protein
MHSLSDKFVRAVTVVDSCTSLPGAIPSSKIAPIFNEKSRQMGKGPEITSETQCYKVDTIIIE